MKLYAGMIAYRLVAEGAEFQPNARFLFTGNSTIKANGALVMGRGAAREVRDLYPGIDRVFGDLIKGLVGYAGNDYTPYGILFGNLVQAPFAPIGLFQVKYRFNSRARLELIEYSARLLGGLARSHPDLTYYMNYPGVGNGGLTRPAVEPILVQHLPDNVVLYV